MKKKYLIAWQYNNGDVRILNKEGVGDGKTFEGSWLIIVIGVCGKSNNILYSDDG